MAENNVRFRVPCMFLWVNGYLVQETNPFTYVEINGLKIPEPSAAYALLWEAVSGHDSAVDGEHLRLLTCKVNSFCT
jgi:Cdc6-like AAA superfamily ATPase